MKIRWDPKKQNYPGIAGRFIVDSYRGQLRVRKWPRKRGTPKSQAVRDQNAWFKEANRLAKHCDAGQQAAAIAMTLGTGLYPRDLLLKCMGPGIIDPVLADGRVIQYFRPGVQAVAWQGFVLRAATDLSIAPSTEIAPTWTLPVRDTALFWDAGTPNQITVPADVTMMTFSAGMRTRGSPGGLIVATIALVGTGRISRCDNSIAGQHAVSTTTGAVVVIAGQIWQARFYTVGAAPNLAALTTFFSGTILEAV